MKQNTTRTVSRLPSITKVRWMLVLYDALLFVVMAIPLLRYIDPQHTWGQTMAHVGLALVTILILRFAWRVYNQIWRYGGVTTYMALMLADACATFTYYVIQFFLPEVAFPTIPLRHIVGFIPPYTCLSLGIRMAYRFVYKRLNRNTKFGKFIVGIVNIFGRANWTATTQGEPANKIKIAIVGAVVVVGVTVVVDVPRVVAVVLGNGIPFTITVSVAKCRKQFTLGAPK